MLRPLLYLSTLIALAETFTSDKEFLISSCPITYFGQTYSSIYANFTEDSFVICFDGFFNPQTSQDCIIGPKPRIQLASYAKMTASPTYESIIKEKVPTISNNLTCSIQFGIVVDGYNVVYILSSFGSETALEFSSENPTPMSCELKVNAGEAERLFADSAIPRVFTDINGCRTPEGGIKINSSRVIPTNCITVSCNMTRSVTNTSCGSHERCDGNGFCLMLDICTVTGPTIIDIHNAFNFIGDRCAYSLVSDSWVSGFRIQAEFKDRRRKDMNFLDSLILLFINSSTVIHLGQGGKVLVNNSLQTLNSTVQEIHGVELSKDQTGVHAQMVLYGRFVSVFFDGNTAQIHIEVPAGLPLDGLCGDSSSFSSAKVSEYSSFSCETLYAEPADRTINCNVMTERCNILQQEPFSSCNAVVDPAPYIAACNETFCKYPARDGLRCQFLWAYARACSLVNTLLGDWWLDAECYPPEAICQDKFCSDHEFCGIKYSGEPGCLCRAAFASSYRESNTLSDPTICTTGSASISLVGCLLEEQGIPYSVLHLNNETCKGEMDEESHMVTFSFNNSNTCGAVITADKNQVTYKNAIIAQNSSSGIIFRHYQFYIDFFCVIIQPEIKTVAFRVKDSSVAQHVTTQGWNYTVTMKAYTNADRTQVVDSNTYVMLNQKIWMCVEYEGLDPNIIALVTDSCWTTNQRPFNSTLRYDLIHDGCANTADQTIRVNGNGVGTSTYFSFNMFKFSRDSDEIYLHCKLNLCIKEENSCIPDCSDGARKRRSIHPKYEPGTSTFITMEWIN